MKVISIHELQSILTSAGMPDLIDVRTPAEFAGLHVPGARSVPLDDLDCDAVLGGLPSAHNAPIYILCHGGTRAKKAAAKFASAGVGNCVVVDGGTQAWVDAGLPVERGAHTVLPLDRQVQVAIGSIVLVSVLLSQSVNHAWIWLSGFVGCGLFFAGLSGVCALRMLMARMPWNQVKTPTNGCCPTA